MGRWFAAPGEAAKGHTTMHSLKLADLTAADIRAIATVQERESADYPWTQVEQIGLSDEEHAYTAYIRERLRHADTLLMNEATLWARAIYPLLMLAEHEPVQAWAQVTLRARYPHVELYGVADGVLGRGIVSMTDTAYYLMVVEAKRGLESQDPRLQLLGQLLAAARLNWERNQNPVQEVFGCYTIIDTWKFLRAVVQDLDSDAPTLLLEPSREYVQKFEAELILKLLKRIVTTYTATLAEASS
jgi:hypothetical protein